MKTIILSIVVSSTLIGCCINKSIKIDNTKQASINDIDWTVPKIVNDNTGYSLTRCACYDTDTTFWNPKYPENMMEMQEYQKRGLICRLYTCPISWLIEKY